MIIVDHCNWFWTLEAGLFTVALVVCSHIKWPGQEAPIAISPTLINLIISTSILHSSNFYIQIICIKWPQSLIWMAFVVVVGVTGEWSDGSEVWWCLSWLVKTSSSYPDHWGCQEACRGANYPNPTSFLMSKEHKT